MKSDTLYKELEKEFIKPEFTDSWADEMSSVGEFLCENFKKRSMGLVCDFSTEIEKVYTAVFPSQKIMKTVLDNGTKDAMLFVHHPMIWDIRKAPEVFQQMDKKLLQQFKNRRISIYNLHVPLDNYGPYSTSVSLSKVMNIRPVKSFAPYFGSLCGIFGTTNLKKIQDLVEIFKSAVGHGVKLYKYNDDEIKDNTVAIIAGGGNEVCMLEEISKNGVNTFITGISAKNNHSMKAHEFAEKHNINILGGTHYSTEKFACISLCKYFNKLGVDSEFIEDIPVMEDM